MIKRKKKTKEQIQNTKNEVEKMFNFFIALWAIRPHYSEISGKWLGKLPQSTYFHHILPKSKHLEAKYDADNIIFLTFEEHQKVEQDCYFYEEVNKRRDKLKIKYKIL